MIEFNYREEKLEEDHNETIFRPVADVILHASNFRVEVAMYIDSGADITLVPFKFGKALGFKQENEQIKQMQGIAGSVPYIKKKIRLQINDDIVDTIIAWALIEDVPALLGRIDIFDKYEITFKQKKKKIFFNEGS